MQGIQRPRRPHGDKRIQPNKQERPQGHAPPPQTVKRRGLHNLHRPEPLRAVGHSGSPLVVAQCGCRRAMTSLSSGGNERLLPGAPGSWAGGCGAKPPAAGSCGCPCCAAPVAGCRPGRPDHGRCSAALACSLQLPQHVAGLVDQEADVAGTTVGAGAVSRVRVFLVLGKC